MTDRIIAQGCSGTWISSHHLRGLLRTSLEIQHSIISTNAPQHFATSVQQTEDEFRMGNGLQYRIGPHCSWCVIPS